MMEDIENQEEVLGYGGGDEEGAAPPSPPEPFTEEEVPEPLVSVDDILSLSKENMSELAFALANQVKHIASEDMLPLLEGAKDYLDNALPHQALVELVEEAVRMRGELHNLVGYEPHSGRYYATSAIAGFMEAIAHLDEVQAAEALVLGMHDAILAQVHTDKSLVDALLHTQQVAFEEFSS